MKTAFAALPLLAIACSAAAADACLDRALTQASSGWRGQMVVSTLAPDDTRDTRVLQGSSTTQAVLRGDEGFRIASITKTFVAATVLRLYEQDRIDLDAAIARHLPRAWLRQLRRDGYAPERITVRHLLSHTSGLADHAQAPQFIAAVKADPRTRWTRELDLKRLVEWTDPVGAPGEKYAYSDTGYVLLGAIVEHITGVELPSAVREQLALDALGLRDTYWERYEAPASRRRAHQVFEGLDTYDWDPSLDLFGGGGLVSSVADLNTFFDALLEGRVFEKPDTLALMQSSQGLPVDSPYRLGLLHYDFDGAAAIGHSGFWGTLVVREPRSGRGIAGAVTDRESFPQLKEWIARYVQAAASQRCNTPDVAR